MFVERGKRRLRLKAWPRRRCRRWWGDYRDVQSGRVQRHGSGASRRASGSKMEEMEERETREGRCVEVEPDDGHDGVDVGNAG